jgi:hypothetical protein
VLLEFQERRFREIASESPVEIKVQLYLCRDGFEALAAALKPHSLIDQGGRRRRRTSSGPDGGPDAEF